jgi:hypothetical protein
MKLLKRLDPDSARPRFRTRIQEKSQDPDPKHCKKYRTDIVFLRALLYTTNQCCGSGLDPESLDPYPDSHPEIAIRIGIQEGKN